MIFLDYFLSISFPYLPFRSIQLQSILFSVDPRSCPQLYMVARTKYVKEHFKDNPNM